MLKLSGQTLDNYDDPSLSVLIERHGAEGVRKKFATVEVPTLEELDAFEDHDFAAIFYHPEKLADDGGQRRVWPVRDPGACQVSLEYFHKIASEGQTLPDEVRNQVASNLVAHADLHGLDVPEDMRKWAEDHGEYLPESQWINLAVYDSPGAPMPKRFAYEKVASNGTLKLYPMDTPELVAASLEDFVKVGADIHGLSEWEQRIVAGQLAKAAEEHGVSVPESVTLMETLNVKTAEEIHGSLLWRVESLSPSIKDNAEKMGKIAAAIEVIEAEKDPVKMAARVTEFDLALGLGEEQYAAGLMRPELVVFEPASKLAASELPLIDRIGREKIREFLGEESLVEFEKDAQTALSDQPEEIREFLLNE